MHPIHTNPWHHATLGAPQQDHQDSPPTHAPPACCIAQTHCIPAPPVRCMQARRYGVYAVQTAPTGEQRIKLSHRHSTLMVDGTVGNPCARCASAQAFLASSCGLCLSVVMRGVYGGTVFTQPCCNFCCAAPLHQHHPHTASYQCYSKTLSCAGYIHAHNTHVSLVVGAQ